MREVIIINATNNFNTGAIIVTPKRELLVQKQAIRGTDR